VSGASDETRRHVPVLLSEALGFLRCRPGGIYVDATLGFGGYAEAIVESSSPSGRLVGLDRDLEALALARARLSSFSSRITLLHSSFAEIDLRLDELSLARVDGIVADLGLSSLQLDDPARGFSFREEGSLDMRFDRSQGPTAADLVNGMEERELAQILRELGEERRAAAIARRLVQRRPIRTTSELRRAVVSVLGPRTGALDPATRTFQALRIAVNRELEALDALLAKAPERLAPGGRLIVISYHSLEDRRVKLSFRARAKAGGFAVLTKKPVAPRAEEVQRNRRARSGKLRALERLS
jgi:16S rRNA (cytosine1402-N4)-methyltransferase